MLPLPSHHPAVHSSRPAAAESVRATSLAATDAEKRFLSGRFARRGWWTLLASAPHFSNSSWPVLHCWLRPSQGCCRCRRSCHHWAWIFLASAGHLLCWGGHLARQFGPWFAADLLSGGTPDPQLWSLFAGGVIGVKPTRPDGNETHAGCGMGLIDGIVVRAGPEFQDPARAKPAGPHQKNQQGSGRPAGLYRW